jgi:hypothetical protein
MEKQFRIYILSGNLAFDEGFTSDDIKNEAVDMLEADTIPQLFGQIIEGLNEGTLSDENWYFVYDEVNGVLLSDLPTEFRSVADNKKWEGYTG